MAESVWVVTTFNTDLMSVDAVFATEAAAQEYVGDDEGYDIEEHPLHAEAPKPYLYYVRGANVLPDGEVKDWAQTHEAKGPAPESWSDDGAPFDGHCQGHCGLHIYVSGLNEEEVEQRYQRHLKDALQQLDGTCRGCGRTENYIAGFWDEEPVEVLFVGGPSDGEMQTEKKLKSLDKPYNGVVFHYSGASNVNGGVLECVGSYGFPEIEDGRFVRRWRANTSNAPDETNEGKSAPGG